MSSLAIIVVDDDDTSLSSSGPEKEEEGLMDDYLRHPHSLLRGCTVPFGTWVVVHLVPSQFGGGGCRRELDVSRLFLPRASQSRMKR